MVAGEVGGGGAQGVRALGHPQPRYAVEQLPHAVEGDHSPPPVGAAMASAQGGCDYAIALVAVAADGSKSACGEGPLYGGDGRRAGRALALEVHVQLPGVASMQQVSLNAEDEHLTLTVSGGDGAPQDTRVIRLPGRCDPEQVGAKWKKKLKTLTVTLPLLDSQAPAAVGRLTQLQERSVLQNAVAAAAAPPPAAAAAARAGARPRRAE